MAEVITIACPECGKKINVASEAVGKRVRCKGCEHVFVVQAPGGAKAAKPAGKAAPTKAPAGAKAADAGKKAADPKAAKPKPDKPKGDDDEDPNPYGVTSLDTAPRCPECANEMESEDAIICLHCGYNTRTRLKVEPRSVEDVTGGTYFLWLLPGIICAVSALTLLTLDIWYTFKFNDVFLQDASDAWYAFMGGAPFIIWAVWAPTVPLMVGLTAFAVKRLIFNPHPPERVRRKKPRAE